CACRAQPRTSTRTARRRAGVAATHSSAPTSASLPRTSRCSSKSCTADLDTKIPPARR
ncbi:MAG: hypothetical protein AVDCRST_MAG67-1467, partial [uncultured Solirubrobacteraceae bacterium]